MHCIKSISEVQDALKDVLSKNSYFVEHDIPIICENAKDIEYQIQSAISKIGSCITITTPSLSFGGKMDDSHPFWRMDNATIVVAETPILNRGRANYSTALDTALQVAETLNEHCGFGLTSIQQSEESGIIIVTVTFKMNIGFKYYKGDFTDPAE